VRKVIGDLHAAGSTVLVSSHLLSEIEATCTHVAVLHRGTVVAQGELAELLQSDSTALQVTTSDVDTALNVLRAARISARPTEEGVRVELIGTTAPVIFRTLVEAGVEIHEAVRQRTGLEELFARLTEAEESDHLSTVDTNEGAR
jgi:ABC-2 type transport system ATP-binding protein